MMRYLIPLLLLSLPILLKAKSGASESLEWQKVNLEEKVRGIYSNYLATYFDANQYSVHVSSVVDIPSKPTFGKEPEDDNKGKKKNKKLNGVINSNKDILEATQSVVLSKLGLEAPLVDDFYKQSDDKDMKMKGNDSYFSDLWEYQSAKSIFNNLLSITVTVYIDETVAKDLREKLEVNVKELRSEIFGIKPEIIFKYIPLKPFQEETKELSDELKELATPIGMLLAALMLGLFAFMIFSKYEKMRRQVTVNNKIEGQEDSKSSDDEKEATDGVGAGLGAELEGEEAGESGISRFLSLLEKNRKYATVLIKKWINNKEELPLTYLTKKLSNDQLIGIFELINTEERESWEEMISNTKEINTQKVDKIISDEVVKVFITEQLPFSDETYDLLFNLDEKSTSSLLAENTNLAPIIFKVLPLEFVSSSLEGIDKDTVQDIVSKNIMSDSNELQELIEEFEKTIVNYVEKKENNAAVAKAFNLLDISSLKNELSIYKAIVEFTSRDDLVGYATKKLPSDLFFKLDDEKTKVILTKYPINRKKWLLMSLDEQQRNNYLEIYAPTGSIAREMIEIEFDSIKSDDSQMAKVEDERDLFWQDYVSFGRRYINREKTWSKDISELVTNWVNEIGNFEDDSDSNQQAS